MNRPASAHRFPVGSFGLGSGEILDSSFVLQDTSCPFEVHGTESGPGAPFRRASGGSEEQLCAGYLDIGSQSFRK